MTGTSPSTTREAPELLKTIASGQLAMCIHRPT